MRQHKQYNAKTLWGEIIFGPLFLLAVTPLVLATPVHATDDNTVELTIGSDADLKPSADSYLHEATTPVKIKTAKPRGFNLTIHADSADLINNRDSSYRIKGMEKDPYGVLLGIDANSNIWGYRLEEGYGTEFMPDGFMHAPAGNEAPSVIIDTASEHDNAGCKGKTKCEVHMTFGAAIAPNSLAAGKYSTTVIYTATAKPTLKPDLGNSDPSIDWTSVCSERYPNSSDERLYCIYHNGDTSMIGYWEGECINRYPSNDEDNYKRWYCRVHGGDMSGYQSPDWNVVCKNKYPGSDAESEDKYDYCLHHYGTIDGYRPDWNAICNRKYYGYGSNARNLYCKANNGDMSEYNPEMEYICREKYPGYGNSNSLQVYCIAHGGNMGGYHP